MPESLSPMEEAKRQLAICNSCRYCEGYCSVFPALERRTHVTDGDAIFLANLCHDCRACHQACMFTLPHPFAVNIPAALSEVRVVTYSRYAWPRRLAALARRARTSTLALFIVGLLLTLVAVAATGGAAKFFDKGGDPGSFYRVVPYVVLVAAGLVASAYILLVLLFGAVHFWRETGGSWREAFNGRAWIAALGDVAILANLRGGGDDCYQPDPVRPSPARRLLHQAVLYGFLLAFVSTTLAAFFQNILGQEPPFPFWSAPVMTGSIGGVLIVIGCSGLLWLKIRSAVKAPDLISRQMLSMDDAFIAVLNLAAITGMLTLLLRGTSAMPTMLSLHLASLVALYATAPYGKFVHVVYRLGALFKNRAEQQVELSR